MGPAEIKQWQDEHGGAAGQPEGPDANGTTTYRASDGNYISVRRDGSLAMRGFAPGQASASPPAQPTSAPASPATPGGGTAMDPNEPIGGGSWLEAQDDFQGIDVPSGYAIGTGKGQYYAHKQTYADGHTVIQWYQRGAGGGPGQPDPVVTTTTGPVATKTKDAWDQKQKEQAANPRQTPQPLPVGASPTQTRKATDGLDHVYQYNPTTGVYDTDLGAIQAAGPPSGKPYIDDGAEAGQSGRRWGWNQQTHAYDRDLGSSPAAQLPTTASDKQPVPGHPGVYVVKTQNKQTNQTETHYENEQGQTVPEPADIPKSRTNPTNNHFEELDPATGQWIDRGPIQKAPVIRPNPVTGEDEQVQEVPDGNGGTKLVVKPIERQGGNPAVPAGAPEIDLSTPDSAYASFMRLYQWATQQVATGKQTPTWLENTLKGPHEAVTLALNREKEAKDRQQQQTTNALTERAQDITQAGSRLSNATSGFSNALTAANETNKLAGPGINAAASTLLGTLALERINAQASGGMADTPSVVPGPVRALPSYPVAAPVAVAAKATPAPLLRPAPPTNAQPSAATPSAAPSVPSVAPSVARPAATNPALIVNPTTTFVPTEAQQRNPDTWPGAPMYPEGLDPQPVNMDPSQGPVGQAPGYGMPVMALASTFGGRPSYDPAIQKMRELGMSDESIQAAMANHLSGVAA